MGIRLFSIFLRLFQLVARLSAISTPSTSTAQLRDSTSSAGKEVSSCLLLDKFRAHLEDSSSWFNAVSKILVVLNVILFALNSSSENKYLRGTIYYGNISFCSIFGFELLVRSLVIGPRKYFDHPSNVVDAFLVTFGLFSLRYPNTGCQYINIFRVLLLLKTNEQAGNNISTTGKLNLSNLVVIIRRCMSAVVLYFVLFCCLIYVMGILSMFILPVYCEFILMILFFYPPT
jgi:hypothetical protein